MRDKAVFFRIVGPRAADPRVFGQPDELVTYGYNAIGQLNSLTSDDGTQYIAATSYNAQGQVIEQRLDAGANGFTR